MLNLKAEDQERYSEVRAQFEARYVAQMEAYLDKKSPDGYMLSLRDGDTYGPGREYLNSEWIKAKAEAGITDIAPITLDDLITAWHDTFSAFTGAFDTPVERRRMADEFSEDARRRVRAFGILLESFRAAQ